MKKALSILLCLSILAGTFAICSFAADGVANESSDVFAPYSDNLITLWDFEGTGDEIWDDKATGGQSDDTLTPNNTTVEVVTDETTGATTTETLIIAENGVVTLKSGTNNGGYLSAVGANADVNSLQNKTLAFKIKTSDSMNPGKTKQVKVMEKANAAHVALQPQNADYTNCFHMRTRVDGSTMVTNKFSEYATHKGMYGEYRWLVMSYAYDAETGAYTESYYVSTVSNPSSDSDFMEVAVFSGTLSATDNATYLTSDKDFTIYTDGYALPLDLTVDEARIYDAVMTINTAGIMDYSDALVSYWDFNEQKTDSDGKAYYEDKANGVNSWYSDNLYVTNSGTTSMVTHNADGTVTCSTDSSNYGNLAAAGTYNTDLYSLKNKTIIMKVSGDEHDNGSSMPVLVSKDGTARFRIAIQNSKFYYGVVLKDKTSGNNAIANGWRDGTNATAAPIFNVNKDIYVIISMSYNEDGTWGVYLRQTSSTVLNPADENYFTTIIDETGTETIKGEGSSVDGASYLTSDADFILGNLATKRDLNWTFDEVRVYDFAMNDDDVFKALGASSYECSQIASYEKEVEGTATDLFDIRFTAAMSNSGVQNIGFDIAVAYGSNQKGDLSGECKYLLSTLNAREGSGLTKYEAEKDFGSKYLYALTISEIPQSLIEDGGSIVFTVTPYTVNENGEKIAVETVTVTVTYDASLDDPFVVTSAAA